MINLRIYTFFVTMTLPLFVYANNLDITCNVVRLMDPVFDDRLSEAGSTESDEDSQHVSLRSQGNIITMTIGTANFSNLANVSVTSLEDLVSEYKFKAIRNGTEEVLVHLDKTSMNGTILHKYVGLAVDTLNASPYTVVAEIECVNWSRFVDKKN